MIANNLRHFGHCRPCFRCNLGSASRDNDFGIRVIAVGFANGLTRLFFGFGGYRASVKNYRIGKTGSSRLITDHFRFPNIQPTAKGLHVRRIAFAHALTLINAKKSP
jgi:hypothetical protein